LPGVYNCRHSPGASAKAGSKLCQEFLTKGADSAAVIFVQGLAHLRTNDVGFCPTPSPTRPDTGTAVPKCKPWFPKIHARLNF
jgi:hypothetical protein